MMRAPEDVSGAKPWFSVRSVRSYCRQEIGRGLLRALRRTVLFQVESDSVDPPSFHCDDPQPAPRERHFIALFGDPTQLSEHVAANGIVHRLGQVEPETFVDLLDRDAARDADLTL